MTAAPARSGPGAGMGERVMSERPQSEHTKTVQASVAHESAHPLGWRLPCRTCAELRARIRATVALCRAAAARPAGSDGAEEAGS
jgi:hypothetical protein